MNEVKEIRALSVRQPWAWAICAGLKLTENRTWTTPFRGTIAIHASSSMQVVNRFRTDSGCELFNGETFPTGAIIGLAEIVDIASYGPQHESDPFAEGPYCWTMTNGRLLRNPIALKGKLNLFKLDRPLQEQLRYAETFTVDLIQDKNAYQIATAMQRDPDPVLSYEELYQESMTTGHHQDSLATCAQRLMELAPNRPLGYIIAGGLWLSESETSDCVPLLKKASELDPDHPLAWYFLTDAYAKENQFELAMEAANQTMRLIPDNAMAFENRGRVHFFAGRFKEAIADLTTAIEMQPKDAGSLAMRAECKSKLGDRTGALADIDAAIAMAPDDPSLVDLRHELHDSD